MQLQEAPILPYKQNCPSSLSEWVVLLSGKGLGSFFSFSFFFFFFFWHFLLLHLQHGEVPRLGVQSDLQLPAYATATATATQDLSHVCNLHHSSRQCQIPNPQSKARDGTHILMDTSRVHFHRAFFFFFFLTFFKKKKKNEYHLLSRKGKNYFIQLNSIPLVPWHMFI